MFRFADCTDYILITIATLAAIGNGAAMPVFVIFWGNVTTGISDPDPFPIVLPVFWQFLYLSIGTLVASFLMMSGWMISGERQAIRCRKEYMCALLRQEIGWFDEQHASELATKVSEESALLQKAIGEKVGTFIMTISSTIAGIIIAFVYGWLLSIVIFVVFPLLGIASYFFTLTLQNITSQNIESYSQAGGKAEEAITGIKTVKALGGEQHESGLFRRLVKTATEKAKKFGYLAGLAFGSTMMLMFMGYAIGFWYGGRLIFQGTINDNTGRPYVGQDVLIIFFSILIGGFTIGQGLPCIRAFSDGLAAFSKIEIVLNRQTRETNQENGLKPATIDGRFSLHNVRFSYPRCKEKVILDDISLEIQQGKRNALVGESGSGKSTVMQLLLRFY